MTARKSAETRKSEILEATLRLADQPGPDRLSTEAIAQAVGLTQPGVFRHFPSKRALWEAVAAAIADRMTAGWQAVGERSNRPVDRLTGLICAQLRLIQSTPAIPAILFSRELHAENDLLRKAVFNLMGRFHNALRTEIDGALEEGTFRPDLDADDVAFLLIGLVQGLAVRWSLSGRTFGLEQEGARLLAIQIQLFETAPDAPGAPERQS